MPGRVPQGVACLALPHGVCSTVSKVGVARRRLEERRRVEFDFDRIALLGLPALELPKARGGARARARVRALGIVG